MCVFYNMCFCCFNLCVLGFSFSYFNGSFFFKLISFINYCIVSIDFSTSFSYKFGNQSLNFQFSIWNPSQKPHLFELYFPSAGVFRIQLKSKIYVIQVDWEKCVRRCFIIFRVAHLPSSKRTIGNIRPVLVALLTSLSLYTWQSIICCAFVCFVFCGSDCDALFEHICESGDIFIVGCGQSHSALAHRSLGSTICVSHRTLY